jgi:hypothetical protein
MTSDIHQQIMQARQETQKALDALDAATSPGASAAAGDYLRLAGSYQQASLRWCGRAARMLFEETHGTEADDDDRNDANGDDPDTPTAIGEGHSVAA